MGVFSFFQTIVKRKSGFSGSIGAVLAALFLVSCAAPPTKPITTSTPATKSSLPRPPKIVETVVADDAASSASLSPVSFSDIPGWNEDVLADAWQAWLQSCNALRKRKTGPVNWEAVCDRANAQKPRDAKNVFGE
jgi:membrane-bound lytic murein transglycosylase A